MINNDIVIEILSYIDNKNTHFIYKYSDSNSIGLGQYPAEYIEKHVRYCRDKRYLDKNSSSVSGNGTGDGILILGLSSSGQDYLTKNQK